MRLYSVLAFMNLNQDFAYRMNFILNRIRNICRFFLMYYFWIAIINTQHGLFGYSEQMILTYIIGVSYLSSIVFSTKSMMIQFEIASGELSNYLLKPIDYLTYWLTRDISEKVQNTIIATCELCIFFLIVRPPFFFQMNGITFLEFILFFIGACLLYFLFNFLVSMITFWYPTNNGWPVRFIIFILIDTISGGLFPLDMLPEKVRLISYFLPTSYFIYIPSQIYLERFTFSMIVTYFIVLLFWVILFYSLVRTVWKKGLQQYDACGR